MTRCGSAWWKTESRVADDDHLAVALAMHSRARGYLSVSDRLGVETAFDAVDVRLFEALAHQAAIALENGGLVAAARDRDARARAPCDA